MLLVLTLLASLFYPVQFLSAEDSKAVAYAAQKKGIIEHFSSRKPKEWGEHASGVMSRLDTKQPVIALTLDACGGWGEHAYDRALIATLVENQIPATIFPSGKWIKSHEEILRELSKNPLFEIENHGLSHKPCSVNGRTVFGLPATRGIADIIDEIEVEADEIESITGTRPIYYRSAGAFSDELCPEIAKSLGASVVSFSLSGDGGARYSASQVRNVLESAPASSIVILHMNHPGSGAAQGLSEALPGLYKRGIHFVKLEEYKLR